MLYSLDIGRDAMIEVLVCLLSVCLLRNPLKTLSDPPNVGVLQNPILKLTKQRYKVAVSVTNMPC